MNEIEIIGINKNFDEAGTFNRLFIAFKFTSSRTDVIGFGTFEAFRNEKNEELFALDENNKLSNPQKVLDAVKEYAIKFHDTEWLARVLPPKDAPKLEKVENDPITDELGTSTITVATS